MGRNSQVCLSCVHNCRFFHSHRTTTTSPNSFYKLIIRQNDFNVLYLPPKLNHIMSTLIDKKINLEDSAGGRTVVTISEVDGSFAFKEGWEVFSKEHGLEIGDIVVFNCINKLIFDVKIYDESVCERLDFSKNRNGRKRDRSGKFVRQNHIENISEKDNEDRRVQSKCTSEHIEDTCYITSHIYQNDDLVVFNRDPMFEEVLGTGDTSYASKLLLLGRNSSLVETDKSTYDDSSALIHGQNKEQKSIMFNTEAQECQFVESLGEFNEVAANMTPKMCSFTDKLHTTELPKVIKGELNQDNESHFETSGGNNSVGDSGKHASHASELEISGRNNSVSDSDKSAYAKNSILKLEENKEGKSIKSEKEIQECLFAEGLELPKVIKGEFNQDNDMHFETVATVSSVVLTDNDRLNAKQESNDISNLLNDQIHFGEMKEVAMEMTPKLGSFNDKLNATGSPEVIEAEFNEDETAETVTCVALTDNHYLKLSICLSLSRTGLGTKRMVVFLRDPQGRLWPVLYLQKTWLTSGWLDFQRANNIKPGDVCVFRVVNKFECIISVHINHK